MLHFTEMNIKAGQQVDLLIETADGAVLAVEVKNQVRRLTKVNKIDEQLRSYWPHATASAVLTGGTKIGIPLEGLIDFVQERTRLSRDKEKLEKETAKLSAQLGNSDFVERAPVERVEELKARMTAIALQKNAIEQNLAALS